MRPPGHRQRARLRASAGQAELRAAPGQLRAFGAADRVRARSRLERRQSQPVRISARRADPHSADPVFGRLLRATLGHPAARPRAAPAAGAFQPPGRLPPLEYTIPAFACVALSLMFFFLQKDMGPAMVFTCLFLALYSIARKDALIAAAGLLFLLAGFVGGYLVRVPHTVYERVSMWASPWNNVIH